MSPLPKIQSYRYRFGVLTALAGLMVLASARGARADRFPHTSTDGLMLGARLEPGAAFAASYDLDIYLTGDRLLSLGPAATFSVLGEEGADLGRQQDFMLAVDALRFKVAVNGGRSAARAYVFVGGGFYWARLPEQQSGLRDLVLEDGTTTTGRLTYDRLDSIGGLVSGGLGLDYYLLENLALAAVVAGHVRISEDERVPIFWADVLVGIRFGL